MQLKVFRPGFATLITMKLLMVLTIVACLQTSARGFGQTVSISLNKAPLEKVFKEITRQTGYYFVYTRSQLKISVPVTCEVSNGELKEVLALCFRNQPLSFVIEDRYVVVQTKKSMPETSIPPIPPIDITGRVINEDGEPLAGVTISAKNSNKGTFTNDKGEFLLKGVNDDDILIITSVGYYKEEMEVNKRTFFLVRLRLAVGSLDETIVMAYGKTSRRLNTGNISKVTAEEISRQPVSNPLATLQGLVTGLVATQTSGVPGASIKVQIRGQNSLSQGSEPLFIIDGVPLAANNQAINTLNSILTTDFNVGLSPFNSINPSDIESIEILKDADATAIYGSRGANGVILITTKRGKVGKPIVSANIYSGWSKITRTVNMLNTPEYIAMRQEAFKNDGLIPSNDPSDPGYAPDIIIWDTTRYTNFKDIMMGNTANTSDLHLSVSGGNQNIQFLLGSGFHHETSVFPGDMANSRISYNSNLNYNSDNKRLSINLSSIYSHDKDNLINSSISPFLLLPPNAPLLYNDEGHLNWEEGGVGFDNPLAYLSKKYQAQTENLIGHLQTEYRMPFGLTFKAAIGYNVMHVNEKSIDPISSQNPAYNPTGVLRIGNSDFKEWTLEPQIEYSKSLGKGNLSVLVGGSWQKNTQTALSIEAGGYTSDDLLESIVGGTISSKDHSFSDYRYQAIFGRINFNWDQKYLVNLSSRRDGSSRFGPSKQYAIFGAIGGGWIFSSETFMQNKLSFISFGKLRASYGSTGNDQIGNYNFLDTWNIGSNPYQSTPVLYPSGLFNADYGWEVNRKFETALELGIYKDRFLITLAYFQNKSGNQLVKYNLPGQTGFPDITKNFPALIQNSGIEFESRNSLVNHKNFQWQLNINLTVPQNKLIAFDGIENSSYASSYVIGQPLNVIFQLRSLGVDPSTGVFSFEDANKDNSINIPGDYQVIGNLDPKYFGGIQNSINYKGIQFDFLLQFKKQTGRNYFWSIYGSNTLPGFMINQPSIILDRWQKQGDYTDIQKLTAITTSEAYAAITNLRYSSSIFTDASYFRIKTLALSYTLPSAWLKKTKVALCRIYIEGQNLITFTNYEGSDPETQNLLALPPLKTLAVGFQLNF